MGTGDEIWEGEVSAHGYRAGDLKERALLVTRSVSEKRMVGGGGWAMAVRAISNLYIAGSGGKGRGTYKAIASEFMEGGAGFVGLVERMDDNGCIHRPVTENQS